MDEDNLSVRVWCSSLPPRGRGRTSHWGAGGHWPAGLGGHLPEKGLHVDDGLGVGHVVLFRAHGALFVHDHHVGSEGHSAPE